MVPVWFGTTFFPTDSEIHTFTNRTIVVMYDTIVLFGPIPGGPELLIILAVIVLLFGANRLPKLAYASGQAMGEFQKGREEVEQEIRAAANAKREAADDDSEVDVVEEPDSAESATATGRRAA
jgi:sec-independent protein translocase protein TatA